MPERPTTDSRSVAVAAARAAAAKQAEDVVVLDVRDLIVITDYFVIASGTSERHVRTVFEAVEEALRRHDAKPVRREGQTELRWVLLDYVDVVVHVFSTEDRAFYDLERLWSDAPREAWQETGAASSG